MNITSQIERLRQLAHELLYLGVDGTPLYVDRFSQLNKGVLEQAETLYSQKGATLEEEANLCLALLMGYGATIYDRGDKEHKKQVILNRAWRVLDKLPDSLLKCQLLVACYGEVFDEEMAQEARTIIDSWGGRELSDPERETIEMLKDLEEHPYPNSEID